MNLKRITSIILIVSVIALSTVFTAMADSAMLVRNIYVDSENKLISIDGILPSVKTNNVLSVVMIGAQKEITDVETTGPAMRFAHLGDIDVAGKSTYDYTFEYNGEKGLYKLYVTLGDLNTMLTVDTTVSTVKEELPIAQLYKLPTEYGANNGADVKERFNVAKNELPDEMPVVTPADVEGLQEIYISSENGSDDGTGSVENPFKTLKKAIDSMVVADGCVIRLMNGIYSFDEILTLNNVHGKTNLPLFISKTAGANVIFTNAKTIKYSDFSSNGSDAIYNKFNTNIREKIICVDLKNYGMDDFEFGNRASFPNIYIGNVKLEPARWPNVSETGMVKYTGANAENGVVDSGPMSSVYANRETGLYGGSGFEICVEDSRPFTWENTGDIRMYGSFDYEWIKSDVKIKSFDKQKGSVRTENGIANGAIYSPNNKFFYYNVAEELDTPGEYYIDKNTGLLYIYPSTSTEDISIVPSENGVLDINNCSNIIIDGITFDKTGNNAVNIVDSNNIVIQNCSFSNFDNSAIRVYGVSSFCGATTCTFENSDGNPARFEHSIALQRTKRATLTPQRNFFQNNYVYNCKAIELNGIGNIVSHNSISGAYSDSIAVRSGNENIVEYNEILCGAQKVNDCGAIYVDGGGTFASAGNHIRYNYIHDFVKERSPQYGIYIDAETSRDYVYGNIVDGLFILINSGHENVIFNNVVSNYDLRSIVVRGGYTLADYDTNDKFVKTYLNKKGQAHYIDVNNPYYYMEINDVWKNRYPSLYDITNKLVQRIEEYKSNGLKTSEIITQYSDGTQVDLDTYLRVAKDNLIENNAIISSADMRIEETSPVTAKLNNNVIIKDNLFYDKKFSSEDSYKSILEINKSFEIPPYGKMGVIKIGDESSFSNNTWSVYKNVSTPVLISPANDMYTVVDIEDAVFKWESQAGASVYDIEISENPLFSESATQKFTVSSKYFSPKEYDYSLETDKLYYWRVTARPLSVNVSGGSKQSAIYTFCTGEIPNNAADITIHDETNNVVICGELNYGDTAFNRTVSVVLMEKETGEIGHIGQVIAAKNSKYIYKFKFDKDIENYNIYIREGGKGVYEGVATAVYSDAFEVIELNIEDGENLSSDGNFHYVNAVFSNKYGDEQKYMMIVSAYGTNGNLISYYSMHDVVVYNNFGNTQKSILKFAVPDIADKVKVFLWSSDSVTPLCVNEEQNIIR